ncbi:hypothetical protein NXS98_02200 [Fontisphaera persica]|uniref:hypothetical protein n=1 Tax=Fontisphaera persica TaxID=2974023 RepID=UPI0024C0BD34|nr:hypothetical protein [Fontisphaera persica]WCJ59959.1 hypothetical protein NXS98_02200 [Fontisphaera persica]
MKTKAILAILAAGVLAASHVGAQQVDTVFSTNSLREPMGVGAQGNYIYITASVNNQVVRFHPGTGVSTVLAGSLTGVSGWVDAQGTAARFNSPQGLLVDEARGGVVISDSGNNAIRLVTWSGMVSTLATGLSYPVGLARDASGNIYIADSGSGSVKILFTNNTVATLAGGFNGPAAVAVGDNGEVWVADTRNHVIQRVQTTGTGLGVTMVGAPQVVAGLLNTTGAVDAEQGPDARFNNPRGLLWVGGNTGLVISDTANHSLRRLYTNTVYGGYTITTVAGGLGENASGFINGAPLSARFNSPVGLCRDTTAEGILVVDRGNSAIRRVQTMPPQPRVQNPRIGYIRLQDTPAGRVAVLTPVTSITFNNDEVIGIEGEVGVQTFFTTGATPSDPLDINNVIPDPGPGVGSTPPAFQTGQLTLPPSVVEAAPNFIIKARSSAQGRQASDVVMAQFIFKTATPGITGDNAAYLPVNNITFGARMFYTTNGMEPVDGPGPQNFGPVFDGGVISLPRSETNTVLKIKAFRDRYQPSETVIKVLSALNFTANKLTLGFDGGEGYSRFLGAPGQQFVAPVTLEILEGQKMYSLQFNAAVTNLGLAPAVNNATLGFESMLMRRVETPAGVFFVPIPPAFLALSGFTNLYMTNHSTGLLMLGYMERNQMTNLYDTLKQHLIQYSIAHNTLFESAGRKVIVGGFRFTVPLTAQPDSRYLVSLGRPSATADGIQTDVFIEAPTNRCVRELNMASFPYIVGDCMPFGWFNAGDFGDSNILSADLMQVFQTTTYGLNRPPPTSDFFDAMDSCCVDTNGVNQSGNPAFYANSGIDTLIDRIAWGDGVLDVNDIFVSFRRALDPSRVWYARYWPTNPPTGTKRYEIVPNRFRGSLAAQSEPVTYRNNGDGTPPLVRLTAADVMPSAPGQEIAVPIQADIQGGAPLRVFMLRLVVEALDGSPAITAPIRFEPNVAFGQPGLNYSRGVNDFAAAWLDNTRGMAASGELGRLFVTIPASANSASAYRVRIAAFSASPNGLGLFPKVLSDGLITLANRNTSSANDGIPDAWKLRYFDSLNNLLTHATADADGDGVPNWQEYKAGTHPNDPQSRLAVLANRAANAADMAIKWPTAAGKRYIIEVCTELGSGNWTPVASGIEGDGLMKEFRDAAAGGGLRFYRVRVQE